MPDANPSDMITAAYQAKEKYNARASEFMFYHTQKPSEITRRPRTNMCTEHTNKRHLISYLYEYRYVRWTPPTNSSWQIPGVLTGLQHTGMRCVTVVYGSRCSLSLTSSCALFFAPKTRVIPPLHAMTVITTACLSTITYHLPR
jgi:hypothetical protein